MARTLFNTEDLTSLDRRLSALDPAAAPRFGKMTPSQMLCHLKDAVEVAMGLAPSKPRGKGLDNRLLRHFIIYYMPWPKGKIQTSPEMLKTQPAEWLSDLARLRDLLGDAARRGPSGAWSPHPAFGDISGKDYGALLYRHFDHHLKQFGV